jgi:hypothetical protein
MSDSKEIRIRAVLDSSTFDKGISEIQEKIKKLTQQQTQGAGAQKALGKDQVMGKYAASAFGDFSKETQQQMQKMYQTQRSEAMQQSITLKGQAAEIAKISKLEGDMTKQQKQRLDYLKQENDLLKEKHRQTLSIAAETQKALDKMAPAAVAAGGAAGGGGPGGPMPTGSGGSGGGMERMFSGLLAKVSAAAVVNGALNTAAQAYSDFVVTRPRLMEQYKGSAMQGAGRDMRESFSGRGSDASFYASERAKAFGMAVNERNSQENLDKANAYKKLGAGAAAGGAAGAYYGTALAGGVAALTGGLGALGAPLIIGGSTAIGAGIGGIMGYAGSSSRERAAIFDNDKYKKMSMAEMMQNREGIEASMIMQDPTRAYARDSFIKDYKGMSDYERSTGIRTNEGMYGEQGFLQSQMRKGQAYGGGALTQEDVMAQTAAIYGAGGSTAGASMSGMAGSVNRQFGIKNAGSVMGGLMGQGGLESGATTTAAYRVLMTEAVRSGVDASKMPQELERFTQVAAQLATAGGGFSGGMAELMTAGTMGTSLGQQQAGASAAQEFQGTAKSSEGIEGQIGYSFLLGSKGADAFGSEAIAKIRKSPELMAVMNQYSAEDLESDPALLKGLARQLGIDPEKLLDAKRQMDVNKQTRATPGEGAMQELGEFTKGKSNQEIQDLSTGDSAAAIEYQNLYTSASNKMTTERGKDFSGKGTFARAARIGLVSRTQAGISDDGGAAELSIDEQAVKPQASASEKEIMIEAKGQMERINNMSKYLDSFGDAAERSSKYANQFAFMLESVDKALKENGPAMTDELKDITIQLQKFSDSLSSRGFHSTKPE